MKIKLAIIDNDQNYLNRIVTAFTGKFSDKLEIYSFSDLAVALETVKNGKIDVLIASDGFEVDVAQLPKRCGFVYFVDSVEIESHKGQRTICKYQKADLIYKEILSIYSELSDIPIIGKSGSEGGTRIISFLSASGGVGSSTLAASFSMSIAKRGQKVLYLNLEQFGTTDLYFSGQGQFDFGDVIYAIKSKKSNLALKLESNVKQDVSGVYFYDSCKVALDVIEMTVDDLKRLMDDLTISGYDFIVLDMNFSLDKKSVQLMKSTHNLVFVSDGSETANKKFERAFNALSIFEQQQDISLCSRISIMYNKFSSKFGQQIDNGSINMIGGVPKFEQATVSQLLNKIQDMQIFDKLI